MTEVQVSVIIACRNARRTIGACLASLDRQETARRYEVVVADSSTDGTDELIRTSFPEVRVLHYESRRFPGDARNAAIGASRGRLLVFLDADCAAAPDWLERMAQAAEEESDSTAGGAIGNGSRGGTVDWAAYFCEFSQWIPPGRAGWMDEVPTCNLAMRREVFDRYGPFLEGVYCSDSAFHWKLRAAGRRARFVPAALVEHHGIGRLGEFLRHERFHGWSYARLRVREERFGTGRRLLHALGTPILPVVLWLRILHRVKTWSDYTGPFWRCTPALAAGLAAWSWGEMLGYLKRPFEVFDRDSRLQPAGSAGRVPARGGEARVREGGF